MGIDSWCSDFAIVDMDSGAITLPVFYRDPWTDNYEEKIEKIKYKEPQSAGVHIVTEEDLDINCHVNNCRYADMTSDVLGRNDYQSFTINFLRETVIGDRIDLLTERAEDGGDIVVGMLKDESVVFQAKVTYL